MVRYNYTGTQLLAVNTKRGSREGKVFCAEMAQSKEAAVRNCTHSVITVVVILAVAMVLVNPGCGGERYSPTEPKPSLLPTPTPTSTPSSIIVVPASAQPSVSWQWRKKPHNLAAPRDTPGLSVFVWTTGDSLVFRCKIFFCFFENVLKHRLVT